MWALLAGGLGIVSLVLALRLANRLVVLPQQQLPDLSHVPKLTVIALLLMAAPVAGIVEEAAFRGYMQGPLERRYGLIVAILITGTMFAVVHLDFTLVLWPVLRGRGRDLRNCDLPHTVDSACSGVTHDRQPLLKPRSMAARSGGMAGFVGPNDADPEHRRRFRVLDCDDCDSHRLGRHDMGLFSSLQRARGESPA